MRGHCTCNQAGCHSVHVHDNTSKHSSVGNVASKKTEKNSTQSSKQSNSASSASKTTAQVSVKELHLMLIRGYT